MSATHFLHAVSRQHSFLATCGAFPATLCSLLAARDILQSLIQVFFTVANLSCGHYWICQVTLLFLEYSFSISVIERFVFLQPQVSDVSLS